MTRILIKRLDTGQFYRHSGFGALWIDDPHKAKAYWRRGDAMNALSNQRTPGHESYDGVAFELVEYNLVETGKTWHVAAIKDSK